MAVKHSKSADLGWTREVQQVDAALVAELQRDLEAIYDRFARSPSSDLAIEIRRLLETRLAKVLPEERRRLVQRLRDHYGEPLPQTACDGAPIVELARMILGAAAPPVESLDTSELLERLQGSMKTVFETLNEIVRALHMSVGSGERLGDDRTIRMLIRERLFAETDSGDLPIQAYLDHIKKAFQGAQLAFRDAVEEKYREMLDEISPEKLSKEVGDRGLRLGPLYRAALFELYEDKYRHLDGLARQGLLTEEVMLAFERKFGERMGMRTMSSEEARDG